MTDWFRSWHGAPTDPKWLAVARRAGVAPGIAVAVAWALMDRASQASERGSVEGYDAEALAYFFGCEPAQVDGIVGAMAEKGMLEQLRFTNWERRQPKREDGGADRAKEWRDRKKAEASEPERDRTQANADERDRTPDTEVETDSEKKIETPAPVLDPGARDDFDELLEVFPRNPQCSESRAEAAWRATKVKDRVTILAAARRYASWFIEDCRERDRTPDAGKRYSPFLGNWIENGDWRKALTLPLKAEAGKPSPDLVVIRPGEPDFAAVEHHRGKKLIVGNSGAATVTKVELEQARSSMAVH